MFIDTPGIREVTVFGNEEKLAETFSEIEALLTKCKYADCGHSTEPGCGILRALETEELDRKQWNNYLKLQKEIAFSNSKMNKVEKSNSKKKWTKINTNYKAKKKFKGKD